MNDEEKDLIEDAENCFRKNHADQTKLILLISWGVVAIFLAMNINNLSSLCFEAKLILYITISFFILSILCEFFACNYGKAEARKFQAIIYENCKEEDIKQRAKYDKTTNFFIKARNIAFVCALFFLLLFLGFILFMNNNEQNNNQDNQDNKDILFANSDSSSEKRNQAVNKIMLTLSNKKETSQQSNNQDKQKTDSVNSTK